MTELWNNVPYLQKALPHHAQHWYALLEQDRAWLEEWMPHLKEIRSVVEAEEYIQKNARSDKNLSEHFLLKGISQAHFFSK